MTRRFVLASLATLALAGCDRPAAPGPASEAPAAAGRAASADAARLLDVVDGYYEGHLALNPLVATERGDHRYDDRYGDYASAIWMADSLAIEQEALERLATVDAARLAGEDLVTYEAFRRGRELRVEGYRYPSELLPIHPFDAAHTEFAVLASGRGAQPFRTLRDYENFLARMDGYVEWTEQVANNLRLGLAKGVVLPQLVVERTVEQLDALATDDPRASAYWQPILNFPAGLSVADRQRLITAYDDKLRNRVLPAQRRLRDYLQVEYLPQARDTIGWSELPNGPAWYAWLVRYHTSTSLTPDEVHELGLAEVARLRGQMEPLARELGHPGDLAGLFAALRADPAQSWAEPAEAVAAYRSLERRVDGALPLLFPKRPKAGLEVRAYEPFRAASMPGAGHAPPSDDGSRPGVLYVNTLGPASRPKYLVEATYLHEAVPGRHLRAALALEATGLPRYRRHDWDPAHVAGWALYAESLGRDLGLYTDAWSAFGALASELQRAVALAVDTGIHARGWTRAEAVEYYRANTPLPEADLAAAVDRHIALPAEALAYKVGQLRILELRRRAEQALGPRFDVRAFHAEVLDGGSLPLPVLEAKIGRWIESQG
ncbi:MAG: DUF885 domain-containing protein [Lysobacterales bacterium]|nr:MAG: DUF885 domain-containing protein [Xanthomonadales bacterium]